MNIEDLPERSRIELERIHAADSRGCGINASAMCERYGKSFDEFRTEWASYNPVTAFQEITDRKGIGPVTEMRDGEIWVHKRLASQLLQFCDIDVWMFVCDHVVDIWIDAWNAIQRGEEP